MMLIMIYPMVAISVYWSYSIGILKRLRARFGIWKIKAEIWIIRGRGQGILIPIGDGHSQFRTIFTMGTLMKDFGSKCYNVDAVK